MSDTVGSRRSRVSCSGSLLVRRSIDKGVLLTIGAVNGRVVLLESRCLTVTNGVVSRGVGSVTIASVERLVSVVTGHNKVASHFVEGVEAFKRCRCNVATSNADSETDHVVRDKVHPLLVEDVTTSHVGCNISSNGVTHVGGPVGVQFTTLVTSLHADFGEITKGHDLEVQWGLDEVDGGKGTVGL